MKKVLIIPLIVVLSITLIQGSNIFANEETIQGDKSVEQSISSDENQNLTESTNNISSEKEQTQSVSSRASITSTWGTSSVEFDDSSGILTVKAGTLSPRISSEYIDTANTIKKRDIKEIILENGVVAPANSNYLFSGNTNNYWFNNLTSIQGTLNTSLVTNMRNMFFHAEGLLSLDVSNWDTSKVTDMSYAFFSCGSLTTLDVADWTTSKVTSMQSMFGNGYSFTTLDVSDWDTSEVTNMSSLFAFTTNLPYLDVSKWKTDKVTTMSIMFSGTRSLTSIDLSEWNTSKVTAMNSMFSASGFTALDLSNWDTRSVTIMSSMFSNTSKLNSLNISNWDTRNVIDVDRMFSITNMREITLGDNSVFNSTTSLPAISTASGAYSGKWERIIPPTPNSIYNSSSDFMNNYDGSMAGTYVWQLAKYTITYDLNGGVNAPTNPEEYTYGTGVTSFANPTKVGYTFLGWVDSSDNPITTISTTATGNKTLIATWKISTYTITYNLNGGINSDSNPSEYTYGIGITGFEEAQKDEYTFIGWFDSSDNRITDISTTETGNKTLNAKWKANVYNIEYELDGGTNSANNPSEYTYGIGITTFEEAKKDGYTFIGWEDSSGEIIRDISTTETGNKTLVAKWEANVYQIKYELNGGINSPNNPSEYTYGIGIKSFENPTKEGYEFAGWYLESTAKSLTTKVASISNSELGNKTLFAEWKKQGTAGPTKPPSTLLRTGDSNSHASRMLIIAGFLISGIYLVIRRKDLS